jgi:outer membrane protein TolC
MKHLATNIRQFPNSSISINFFPPLKDKISINLRRLIFINSCLLISVNFPSVYAQETESLNQYLPIAAENNPRLKSLFNQYLAALEEVPQVGSLPDPQLSFAVFIQPIETRVGAQRASFSVSQMFPWFGTLTAQERVAAERAKARLQQFEDAKLELFKQVKVTYNDLYYLQKATQITQENLKLLASFKELARVNFEGGRAGFADVLRVEVEEEALQNKLQYLEEGHLPLITQFEQLLNQTLAEPAALPDSLWQEELALAKDSIFRTILANNPRLEELRYEAQAYESQATVAQKMGLPSFTLGGSYTSIAERTDMEMPNNGQDAILFPQVGVRLPLYRKKFRAMEKQALLQQEAAALSQESTQDQLRTELEQLYRNYLDAQRRVALNRRLADLAERTLGLLQTEFTTGEADFEEIIRLQQQLLEYQLQEEKARIAQNNYVYSIEYLMGK